MLELLRTYLGYCSSCHMPKMVGEFALAGWRHRFNLCTECLAVQAKRLEAAAVDAYSVPEEAIR